jgi:hypothetical protein
LFKSLALGANSVKLFTDVICGFRNKRECLSLASLSSLVQCLWVTPGAYTRGGKSGATERLSRDKHSSLLRISVNYDRKKFYRIGPRVLFVCIGKVMRIYPTNKFYSHTSNINNYLTKTLFHKTFLGVMFATLGVTPVQNVA